MRSRYKLVVVAAVWFTCRAEILDRIAATVGTTVITESDVIRDLRIAALLDQKPLDLSGDQKRKAADRLVDQTLIVQEADFSRVAVPAADDVARLLAQVKSGYPSEADYRAALQRYHVTEEELVNHLRTGLRAMTFTELRFRPEIQISPEELREFHDRMASENPGQVPAFEESRDQMEKLLMDQRVTQALDRWLGMQRTETEILYREPAFK
jgi:hypothetical protein